jgi:hypothetical protein
MSHQLPRVSLPPLQGSYIEKHFQGTWQALWGNTQAAGGHSPSTVGNAREFFVQKFLSSHLPPILKISGGHILLAEHSSSQIDVLIYRNSGIALPIGDASLVFPESVIAAMEVKSTLRKEDFLSQIAETFRALPCPQPLKVIVALELQNRYQYRRLVAQWAQEGNLEPEALPDLILILDNSAVIRGNALRCLMDTGVSAGDEATLYKLGNRDNQKWLGLMLLVFELAQRIGETDWRHHIKGIVDQAPCLALPD